MPTLEPTLEEQFGKRVRALRTAKGITQMELAEQMNITCQGISRIERGGNGPRFPTIAAIARTLGVKPRDLFDF